MSGAKLGDIEAATYDQSVADTAAIPVPAVPTAKPKEKTKPVPLPDPSEPSNVAERALIGALLQDGAAYPVAVSAGVVDESFTDAGCRDAWVAVRRLHEKGKPVDPLTVSELMRGDQGENLLALGAWMDECPTAVNAGSYAAQVAVAHRRERLRTAARLAVETLGRGGDVSVVAEQLKAAGEAVEAGGAEALTVAEAADYAANDPPPLDPIIEGICECGDKGELVAGSKRRKTFFLLLLLLHLAMGRAFLGFKIPKRRRVMWVNLELKKEWGWRRIHKLARSVGIEPEELRGWFFVVNARSRGEAVRGHLRELVVSRKVELAGIDPRYKLHKAGESENLGEGVQGILDLQDQIAEAGAAVLTVHHDSKGDNSEKDIADRGGGSGWAGRDVDFKITLSAQRDDPDNASVVELLCRNYPPNPPFCIRWEDGRFELASDLSTAKHGREDRRREAQAKPTVEDCESAVLAVLGSKLMGRVEIVGKVQSQVKRSARETIRAAIDSLVGGGKLACTPRAGNKNGVVRYGLPAVVDAYIRPKLKLGK